MSIYNKLFYMINLKRIIKEELLNSNIRYRIVSDYGYGDKTWSERNLTKDEVRDWFIKHTDWTKEDFDDVGIDYFLYNSDFIHYVEKDRPEDKEDWDWWDS